MRLEETSLIYFIRSDKSELKRSLVLPRESGLPRESHEESPGICQVVEFWQTADEQAKR